MESRPSFSGRFETTTTSTPSRQSSLTPSPLPSSSSSPSSAPPSRENSLSRTTSTSSPSSTKASLFEHNLSSILNNPHSSRSADASWLGWWSSTTSLVLPEFAPINTAKPELDANRSDFQPYLNSISEHYTRFEDIRNHSSKENVESIGGQGEALVACLREVPALYFKEDFELEDGTTFRAACPFSNVSENLVLQERLSQYLDVVEMHLVKEISLRSNSFFEAQQQLGDLSVKIVEGCKRIRELKETVRLLDADVVGTAKQIQDLSSMRTHWLALQQKLRLILYVNQALSALKLLVASADCAGALDIADDLQQLLNGDELTGLHCFRHLRDHVATSMDSINSILSAEFLRASLHDMGNLDAVILSKAKEKVSASSNGRLDDVKLDEEETSYFRDRLLPVIIGLLRTAKLPSVLRIYSNTLTADMKIAIKTAVAELLPILVARPPELEFATGERTDADGGGSSLASRLRSLSAESFVQLLSAVFKIVLAHLVRAAEVKRSIEWIMSNLDGHYAAETVAAAIAHGAATTESAQDGDSQGNNVVAYSTQRSVTKALSSQGKTDDVTSSSNVSKNFRVDVLRENAEAVFAACDAAHGRWAKLLGVRAVLHPKIRLQEFLSIYSITQEFITSTEKIGGRLGYSIRGTLQSQAKAFVDFQHESRLAKLLAVLDQETWSEVDVPDEFQTIVTTMVSSRLLTTASGDGDGDVDSEVVLSNGGMGASGGLDGDHPAEHAESSNGSRDTTASESSVRSNEANDVNRTNAGTSAHSRNSNRKTLMYRGVGYHMVNCGLILLKMLSEYVDMNDSLPTLSPEIVQRIVDVLRSFNARSSELVLGAKAMTVSGLKSITSKHLALTSQVVSFIHAIIPDIRQVLFSKIPENRKVLLQIEMDRVSEDYKHHHDEIHSKLVQIMTERLSGHLANLDQLVESWNRPDDTDTEPSQFAKLLTKEVNFLHRVLSRVLHEEDLKSIFRQVVEAFHERIPEKFSTLNISTPQANTRLCRDTQQILACIRSLPDVIHSETGVRNWGQLDEYYNQRFGGEADQ